MKNKHVSSLMNLLEALIEGIPSIIKEAELSEDEASVLDREKTAVAALLAIEHLFDIGGLKSFKELSLSERESFYVDAYRYYVPTIEGLMRKYGFYSGGDIPLHEQTSSKSEVRYGIVDARGRIVKKKLSGDMYNREFNLVAIKDNSIVDMIQYTFDKREDAESYFKRLSKDIAVKKIQILYVKPPLRVERIIFRAMVSGQ